MCNGIASFAVQRVEGQVLTTPTGDSVTIGPRGTPHNFQNLGHTTGRLLVIASPAGLERFFEQCAAPLTGPVGPDALAAVGHLNRIDFVGPPLGVSDPL